MKKFFWATSAFVLTLGLWACGDDSSASADPANDEPSIESSDSEDAHGKSKKRSSSSAEESSSAKISSSAKADSSSDSKSSSSIKSSDSKDSNLCEAESSECDGFESSSSAASSSSSEVSKINSSSSVVSSSSKAKDPDSLWTFYSDPENTCTMTAALTDFPEYNFKGLKGTTVCGEGEEFYAGAVYNAFDEPTDISSWNGLCVVYESPDILFRIGMVPSDAEVYTENNNYVTYLGKTKGLTVAEIQWKEFTQLYTNAIVDQQEFLKRVTGFSIQIEQQNITANFTLYKIGKMGDCNAVVESSSSALPASSAEVDTL